MLKRIKKLWNALHEPPVEVCWLLLGAYYGAVLTIAGFMVAMARS